MEQRRSRIRADRLPLRVRLTLAFAAVMAAVLAAAGVFLYSQFAADLDAQIDAALRAEASDLAALVEEGGAGAVVPSGQPLAQVYGADGRPVAATRRAAGVPLLTRAEAVVAGRRILAIRRRGVSPGAVRIRAVPARAPSGRRLAVVVADRLAGRDRELARLRTLLLIAGPLALLLAGLAGHEVARAALGPVERMRRQAERITEQELSERLPVPASADEVSALGRTLNAMLDRVEAAVARERRVVSDASHELRTPLTTLRAEVDLALLGERDADELRAALRSAAAEARRMSRLADDLLVLARADQGRLPLHPERLVARDVLEAAAARSRAAAQIQARSLVVAGDATGEITVVADRDRTAQTLDNLVANALRYGAGTITLSACEDGELVELHVADEGPGFPDELLGRAFERFARGPDARGTEPRSGLGLALVEALALAHGGHARARNRAQGGADVFVALPRA